MSESSNADSAEMGEYSAFEKWEYKRVFIEETENLKPWIRHSESFYRAAYILIKEVAEGRMNEDEEGIAGLFLFRHYLELALKRIVVSGKWLTVGGNNAELSEAPRVGNIHQLDELWKLVLSNAKPKLPEEVWKNYDIGFVEQCITEFNGVDHKSFTFRYAGQGADRLYVYFTSLYAMMDHVYQVLEGIRVCLQETYSENAEYEAFLESEFGGDYY